MATCSANGITLIVVPYWWDNTIESVAATIHKVRPDISLSSTLLHGKPIPSDLMIHKITKGELYIRVDSVEHYHPKEEQEGPLNMNLTRWWAVKRYEDAMRVFWDGNSKLSTKHGTTVRLANWINYQLPHVPFEAFLL